MLRSKFIVLFIAHTIFISNAWKFSWSRFFLSTSCAIGTICFQNIETADAGMLTFPLPNPLKNNIVFVRSGESFADARHEIETNPVKKLRQDNGLTKLGEQQITLTAEQLLENGFSPTYIWTSNTERAYETAVVLAKVVQLGQNRIVPEYSFLDARAAGKYEGQNDELAWKEIHYQDEVEGTTYRPPPNNDGTPSESVSDVLVRGNQLVSTIESMYSGENVVIVSPDSENLSILMAALSSEEVDNALRHHATNFPFRNGEWRKVNPLVVPPKVLYSGQTIEEADINRLKARAMRVVGTKNVQRYDTESGDWLDLWQAAIDFQGT
jgi:broad specificity phosphatase PhoE